MENKKREKFLEEVNKNVNNSDFNKYEPKDFSSPDNEKTLQHRQMRKGIVNSDIPGNDR